MDTVPLCVAGQIIVFLIYSKNPIRLNRKGTLLSQSCTKLAKFPRVILLINHMINCYLTNFDSFAPLFKQKSA